MSRNQGARAYWLDKNDYNPMNSGLIIKIAWRHLPPGYFFVISYWGNVTVK